MPTSTANPLRVAIVQGGIGAAWLFGSPHRTATNAYQPAVRLAHHFAFGCYPMRVWGGLLLAIAVGLVVSMLRRRHVWAWSAALAMFWAFWVVQYGAAIFTDHGGIAPAFFAAGFGWYAFDRANPPRSRKG